MKKAYIKPEMTISRFEVEEYLTTSSAGCTAGGGVGVGFENACPSGEKK